MEPEINYETTEQTVEKSNLHNVTPLSKYLAMALFVVLPFLGGWIGYQNAPEKIIEVEKEVFTDYIPKQTLDNLSSNTKSVVEHNTIRTRNGLSTYTNTRSNDISFSFEYPIDWNSGYLSMSSYMYETNVYPEYRTITLESDDMETRLMEIGDTDVIRGARIVVNIPIANEWNNIQTYIERERGLLNEALGGDYSQLRPVSVIGASEAVEFDHAWEGPLRRCVIMVKSNTLFTTCLETEGEESGHEDYAVFKSIADSLTVVKQ